jgi:putative MATE family efflux protein
VWRLAIPVAVGRVFQAAAGFIDIAMVGSLGAVAIAAVGVGRQVVFVSEITMLGVIVGSQALVARAVGAGDRMEVSRVSRQALVLGAVVSLALGAAGALAAEDLMRLVGSEGEVLTEGTTYTRIFFAGIAANMLSHVIINNLQAAGESGVAFKIVAAINVFHVLFDYVFIYGVGGFPAMGVAGAAWGMIASRFVGWLIGMAVVASGRYKVAHLPGTSFKPDLDRMRRIIRIGLPVAMQGLGRSGASLVFIRILATAPSPTVALAAYAIGSRMEQVSMFLGSSFSTAALSLVGQSLGTNERSEAERRGWVASALGVAAMSLLGVVAFAFAEPLMAAFTSDVAVQRSGVVFLQVLGLSQPFLGLAHVMSGALQGAGATRPPFLATMVSQWLVALPLAYVLVVPFDLGSSGAWWAIGAAAIVQAALLLIAFRRGGWKHIQL